jgi:hypothetical protein
MEKTNQIPGHWKYITDLKNGIILRYWGQLTLNLSYLRDKIMIGEFGEMPGWLQTRMRTYEVNQELRLLKQKVLGNNIFSQPIMSNYVIQNESIDFN